MGGRASRRKGHTWEREVAYEHLAPIFGEVRRGRQSRKGHDEADVVLPDVVPFWPECQHSRVCDTRGKLRQAVAAEAKSRGMSGKSRRVPVAFLKDTHQGLPGTVAEPPIVAMYLPDWLGLAKEWWELKNGVAGAAPGVNRAEVDRRLREAIGSLELALEAHRRGDR